MPTRLGPEDDVTIRVLAEKGQNHCETARLGIAYPFSLDPAATHLGVPGCMAVALDSRPFHHFSDDPLALHVHALASQ